MNGVSGKYQSTMGNTERYRLHKSQDLLPLHASSFTELTVLLCILYVDENAEILLVLGLLVNGHAMDNVPLAGLLSTSAENLTTDGRNI